MKSNLTKVNRTRDEAIDYTDSPPLDDSFFTRAVVEWPPRKASVTRRLDADVLRWFRAPGAWLSDPHQPALADVHGGAQAKQLTEPPARHRGRAPMGRRSAAALRGRPASSSLMSRRSPKARRSPNTPVRRGRTATSAARFRMAPWAGRAAAVNPLRARHLQSHVSPRRQPRLTNRPHGATVRSSASASKSGWRSYPECVTHRCCRARCHQRQGRRRWLDRAEPHPVR